MDIQRVNSVLERAILGLQEGEIDRLWEFSVPSPADVARRTGMPLPAYKPPSPAEMHAKTGMPLTKKKPGSKPRVVKTAKVGGAPRKKAPAKVQADKARKAVAREANRKLKAMAKQAAGGLGRGSVVGDGTVGTFLNILEAVLNREARSKSSDIKKRDFQKALTAARSKMKGVIGSEDRNDLWKMAEFLDERIWDDINEEGDAFDEIDTIFYDWYEQVEAFRKNKKLPYAYPGTKVKPWVDPRQMGMKYESQQPMWSLVG